MRFGLGFVAGAAGGELPPVEGTYRASAAASSISNVDIGAASASRLVVVVGTELTTSAQGTLSCTIGGVAATKIRELKSVGVNGSVWQCLSMFALFVPTGTTATCALTNTGGTVNRIHMAVWTIDNATSIAPDTSGLTDLSKMTSGGAKTVTLNDVKDNSFVIDYGHTYTSAALTHTWSAPVVTDFNTVFSSTSRSSGGHVDEATGGDKTYTNTLSSTTSLSSGGLMAAAWSAGPAVVPPPLDYMIGHIGKFNSPGVTTYSMPSVTIPASETPTYLLVAVSIAWSSGVAINDVRWNGIQATTLISTVSTNFYRSSLCLIEVPPHAQDATADIVVTYAAGSGGQNVALAAWVLPELASATPTDAKAANSNGVATAASVSLTTTANAIAIAYVFEGATTTGVATNTWTSNVTADFDLGEDAATAVCHSGARGTFNTAGAKTISVTPSKTTSGRALVAVSFPLA